MRVKYGAVFCCCRGLRGAIRRVSGQQHSRSSCFAEDALPCAPALTRKSIAGPVQSGGFPRGLHSSCLLLPYLVLFYLLSPLGFAVGFLFFLFSSFFLFQNNVLLLKYFREKEENAYWFECWSLSSTGRIQNILCFVSLIRTEALYHSLIPSPSQQTHKFKCQYPEGRESVWQCGGVCE